MSIQFQAHPYRVVAAILPQRKRDIIDSKTSQAKVSLQKFNVQEEKVETNWFPLMIALGAIAALGGIFLTLAAHQILPYGVNSISNLGVGGQILGYCTIGAGTIVAIIGAVKHYLIHKQNSKIDSCRNNYTDGVEGAQYNAEVSEMDSYFPHTLKEKEFFIVDDVSRSEITIYYCEWNEVDKQAYPDYVYISYRTSSPKKVFEDWCEQHQKFAAEASCINLQTLQQRIVDFENTKK